MRVTVWEQFSGNHSSSYAIVGRFISDEQAALAEEKVNKLLSAVEAERNEGTEGLTVAELEVAENLGIAWYDDGIEMHLEADLQINRIDRDLILNRAHPTWENPVHLRELLEALGASHICQSQYEQELNARFVCTFRDREELSRFLNHLSSNEGASVRFSGDTICVVPRNYDSYPETAGKPPKSEERYCKQRCFMIKRIHERAT